MRPADKLLQSDNEETLELFINRDVQQDYHGDENREIAKIVDVKHSKDVLYVFYDKIACSKIPYHVAAGLYDENGVPAVIIDDAHKDCLYDNPEIFFAMMLHELGHYRNGDTIVDEDADPNIPTNLSDRTRSIAEDRVQRKELLADAFAVKHIGKNKMIRAIDYMIKKRKEREYDPVRELAIKEFEKRKKAIQKLK